MNITVLFFGISSDLVTENKVDLTLDKTISIAEFRRHLLEVYPALENIKTYALAVNEAYATDDFLLKPNDVVAVIPPVSGG
ncbi:MoaD/ThiS family protein [Polaribacter sp. MED152]|uniref:MoaD/ThiS family protein n=1 Tax=Polaribacter sp. MED152 TaxID=313598 RepID=UPI000068C86C|nr:MoaD/ThiS family protein [Polaribacter sp. MED152]EAQ42383.1 molybdopterin converting factor subunit 1 [Polaribacter sp. MED152]